MVKEFERAFANYVGAKYACGVSSATNAIFLSLYGKNTSVEVPSMIPPVVCNAIIHSKNKLSFNDNTDWVGHSYLLKDFGDYKIIDSAQRVDKNQFSEECNPQDLVIFSFYPTKPVGSLDGGMIVSNDRDKIYWFKEATMNGTGHTIDSWARTLKFPGWKMYLSTIQAEIAYKNLEKLEEKKAYLKKIREYYNNKLGYHNISDHLYRINVKNNTSFIEKMKSKNIQCGIHYKSLHNHPVYKGCFEECPNSEKEQHTTVSIPYNEKITISQSDYITHKIVQEL